MRAEELWVEEEGWEEGKSKGKYRLELTLDENDVVQGTGSFENCEERRDGLKFSEVIEPIYLEKL
jgi:hypothetical protein